MVASGRASRNALLLMMAVALLVRRSCCIDASPSSANQTRAPALFVFGDSIVDPGNNNVIETTLIHCNFPPYGQDFPGHNATGRFSNGKVPGDILGTRARRRRFRLLRSRARGNVTLFFRLFQHPGWASRSTCRRTSARSSATWTCSPASASPLAPQASTPSPPSSW
jgi:hypothetical protein